MSIALKFTSLFVRTLAKPIANQIKAQAREHPAFRKRCIKVAQAIHRTEYNLRSRLLNENDKKIKPLNDAKAIQTGATFVAESFVFSVAGFMILYESWRSRRKQQKQQESVSDDIRILQDEITWIKQKLEESTIIKRGENAPLPEGLKPAILKFIAEQRHNTTDKNPQESVKPQEHTKPQNDSKHLRELKKSQELVSYIPGKEIAIVKKDK